MNKNRRDITTMVLFGLAAVLLVLGTAGTSQAALTISVRIIRPRSRCMISA